MTSPLVVHVTTTDVSLEYLLGPQLEAIEAAGYRVVTASAPGPAVDALRRRGIEHVPVANLTRAWAPLADLRALVELYRLFRRLSPDIVHTHNPKPGVYGRIAARLARVPAVVNTVHGLYATPDDPLVRRAFVYVAERIAAMCSSAELVQGREDLEQLRRLGVPSRKLHLLGNGVDLDRFRPGAGADAAGAIRANIGATAEDVVVGTVGRLVWEKGFAQLFEAARLLRDAEPRVHFVVVGDRDPAKADSVPDDAIRDAEASGVHVVGFRDDIVDWYAAMDVFVSCSRREGFLRSGMEAAAMARPVVVTDARGCREVVDDGVTGYLVPVGDAAALADRVRTLAGDVALRTTLGDAGRRLAEAEFDQRRVVERTVATYERVLAGRVSTERAA